MSDVHQQWTRRDILIKSIYGASAGLVGGLISACYRRPDQAAPAASQQTASSGTGGQTSRRMVAGTQQSPTSPEMARFFKRCGVTHVCGFPVDEGNKGYYSKEDILRVKSVCEAEGLTMAMIALPFLTSSHVDKEKRAGIVLGQSPDREKDVADIIRTLEACAHAGVPSVKYNMSLLGVMRTESTPGRGGVEYSTYRLSERRDPEKLTRAGVVSEDAFWERITWFLGQVVPVATSLKVRMACHPQDPGTPPGGLHGIVNVLGTPDGLKKFVSIHESPYHGLNLCLGTTAEMLKDPRAELPAIVEYFATRKKIFNIHFRNIKGRRDDFMEVFPDEGDIDLPGIARILARHDYEGMLMPDHAPHYEGDPKNIEGFAFEMGYIKGVLQSI